MKRIIEYLETHPQFINLVIFLISLLVAWLSGALRAIKSIANKLDNRLRISLQPSSSHITILREFRHNDYKAQRFAFWLSLQIMNPSEKIQTITQFTLQFRTVKRHWSKQLLPITFPNIPRIKIGENIKYLPVYFTHFVEIENILGKEFTPTGSLKPGDLQTGYLLFIEEFYGDWLPNITRNGVKIKVRCQDLRGKCYKNIGWARSLSEEKTYEIIPGLEKYEQGEDCLSSIFRWEQNIDPKSELGQKIKETIDKRSP